MIKQEKVESNVFNPKQERSANTQAAILRAAREIVSEGGVDSLTISAVAARVGLTTGAFYARFRSKKALLQTLLDETLSYNRESVKSLITELTKGSSDLTEVIKGMVPPAVRLVENNSALFRLFGSDHSGPISESDRGIQLLEDAIEPIQTLLRIRASEIPGRDPDLCAAMLVVMVQGMAEFSILLRHSKKPMVPMKDDELNEEIIRSALGYLNL